MLLLQPFWMSMLLSANKLSWGKLSSIAKHLHFSNRHYQSKYWNERGSTLAQMPIEHDLIPNPTPSRNLRLLPCLRTCMFYIKIRPAWELVSGIDWYASHKRIHSQDYCMCISGTSNLNIWYMQKPLVPGCTWNTQSDACFSIGTVLHTSQPVLTCTTLVPKKMLDAQFRSATPSIWALLIWLGCLICQVYKELNNLAGQFKASTIEVVSL
jgi:hypothetical protein